MNPDLLIYLVQGSQLSNSIRKLANKFLGIGEMGDWVLVSAELMLFDMNSA